MPDRSSLEDKKAWLYPDPDRPCICNWGYTSSGRLYGVNMGYDWHRTSTHDGCWHHGLKAQEHYRECQKRFRKTGKWEEFHVARED